MNNLTLKTGGHIHEGWKSIRVTRSLDAVAHSFELSITDSRAGDASAERVDRRIIQAGEACEIHIDNTLVISGYIDRVTTSYDATSHSIGVSGRSKAGDLVDCSHPGQTFINQDLKQLMQDLCEPFGISVSSDVDVGAKFEKETIAEGDTWWEFFDRLAADRGLRITSTPEGNLKITRGATERIKTPLRLGVNIKAASDEVSYLDRFSSYLVRSQNRAGGDHDGAASAMVEGKVSIEGMRFRPSVISANNLVDAQACRLRAEWRKNTLTGRSRNTEYTLSGWHHADGLWDYNKLVRVEDDYLGIDKDDAERVIESVNFTLDADGMNTRLRLTHPDALKLAPSTPQAQT